MRAINLLPKDDARRNQTTQWLVIGPVLGAVVLSAVLSFLFLSASGKVKDRRAELASLQVELASIPTPDTARQQTEAALAADKESRVKALNAALSRRIAWDRLLREFSLVLPDDVWLKSVTAKAPVSSSVASVGVPGADGTVVATGFLIDGYTYSHAAVARLLGRLAAVPSLHNVQLQQSTLTTVGTSQAVHFLIAADVQSPGGGS